MVRPSEDDARTDRAMAGIEAMADAWIAGTNIHKAIAAASQCAAGPFKDRLASAIYGLVSQAYIEAFYAGFNYHKDGAALRAADGADRGERGDQNPYCKPDPRRNDDGGAERVTDQADPSKTVTAASFGHTTGHSDAAEALAYRISDALTKGMVEFDPREKPELTFEGVRTVAGIVDEALSERDGAELMREQAIACAAAWRGPVPAGLSISPEELATARKTAAGIEAAIRALPVTQGPRSDVR